MATVFDYIDKYKETFLEKEFNEIDNLIFTRFAYIKFDGIIKKDERIYLIDAYKRYILEEAITFDKDSVTLFEKLAYSPRYKDLVIGNYESITCKDLEEQFAAITIYLPDESMYIAFRGTDSSLVGIKEDFNMTYMVHIPSQKDSVKYLMNVSKDNDYKIRVGGHSKGGNLAMYSSVFCDKTCRDKIIGIYNVDGPGFFNEILESNEYKEILNRTYTYVPQTSIIGMLLYHEEECVVVKSNKSLIMQHDVLSWEVNDDKLTRLNSVNKKSKYIDDVMSSLLLLPNEDKKRFFDVFYQILSSTGAKTMKDLSQAKIKSIKDILENYKKLNEEDKKIFIKVWKEIIKTAKTNISNCLPLKKEKVQ